MGTGRGGVQVRRWGGGMLKGGTYNGFEYPVQKRTLGDVAVNVFLARKRGAYHCPNSS